MTDLRERAKLKDPVVYALESLSEDEMGSDVFVNKQKIC